ncbi:hypothetical protein CBM2634_B120110 [Cupriavidus taiwanensis]|uniref:Uncharacterized protein n=1 Tax=Cupriavidus taiwanensis TaxID=164546 RepID=A0A375J4Z4_9BURK|nr:hypothetical protein CBM2634_B120110 [Cupriavidus taiwanensis]
MRNTMLQKNEIDIIHNIWIESRDLTPIIV